MIEPRVETVHHIMPLNFQDKSVDISVGQTIRKELEAAAQAAANSDTTAQEKPAAVPPVAKPEVMTPSEAAKGLGATTPAFTGESAEMPEETPEETHGTPISHDVKQTPSNEIPVVKAGSIEAEIENIKQPEAVAETTEKATEPMSAAVQHEVESESAEVNLEAAISEGVTAANQELKALAPEPATETAMVAAGAEDLAHQPAAPVAHPAMEAIAAPETSAHEVPAHAEDFEMEPMPEPMAEASPAVAQKLGSLTLPAALCDEELLSELAGIPNKMGFKIGEVAEMLGIKQYVLRYWETEFDVLKPKKAANNQRYYTKKDVENVYLIRKLLHRDRFSIEGARSAMKDLKNVVKKEKDWSQVNHKVDTLHERVEHLLVDLRKLQRLFA